MFVGWFDSVRNSVRPILPFAELPWVSRFYLYMPRETQHSRLTSNSYSGHGLSPRQFSGPILCGHQILGWDAYRVCAGCGVRDDINGYKDCHAQDPCDVFTSWKPARWSAHWPNHCRRDSKACSNFFDVTMKSKEGATGSHRQPQLRHHSGGS